MILRQPFHVTGVSNSIAYDPVPLQSTAAEKKRLVTVSLVVDEVADNEVRGYHERAMIFGIPDRLIDVESATGNINLAKPGARINEIPVDLPIPVGEAFKMAIQCAATATDVWGTYNYEIVTG